MILIDLNVLLDVIQKREPHYHSSALVINRVLKGPTKSYLPAHAVTTLHYLIDKYQNAGKANEVVHWLLNTFNIAPVTHETLATAHLLGWQDYEDAVVSIAAFQTGCTTIVTRNIKDFRSSTVPALTPDEFLMTH
jgi:predicted nucleic acid-binding protein